MKLPLVTMTRVYRADCTLALLTLPSGKVLRTIERPWKNNERNVSCIPEGRYQVHWLERSASGKYKRVWHVQNVPDRAGILFHAGNLVRHSFGCILMGMKEGRLEGKPAVLSSVAALNVMRSELGGKNFELLVGGSGPL